jgi:outer membrane receptor protein involved in Fe transport
VYVVGSRPPVVFRLEVTNDGDVPIDGVEVSVDGPMDKFTITGVTPGGSYLGRAFDWPLTIPPHEKRSLQITTFANEPGTYTFRLGLRDFAGHELRDAQGAKHTLTANVVVPS